MIRWRILPITMMICLLLTGCDASGSIYANYRAIEDLQLIQTLGIDSGGGQTILSAAVRATERSTPTVLRSTGGSILDAMNSLQDYSTKGALFFAHTQFLVLGQSYAEGGIREIMDFVERDVHMRLGTELFLLRCDSAESLITGSCSADCEITETLSSIRSALELRGDSHVFNFRETAVNLSECGAALVCALRSAETEGSIFPETENALTAVPDGYGILRGDRLAGFLCGGDAAAASLLLGVPGTAPHSVPDGSGGTVTLDVYGTAALKPAWNADGSPAPLTVAVKLTAALAETDTGRADVTDPAFFHLLSEELSTQAEDDLRSLLAQSLALDADFLALGRVLRQSSEARFAALPPGWLQLMTFDVQVDTEIVHSYDLTDPVQTEGERLTYEK